MGETKEGLLKELVRLDDDYDKTRETLKVDYEDKKGTLKEKILKYAKFKVGDKVVHIRGKGIVDKVDVLNDWQAKGICYECYKFKKDGTKHKTAKLYYWSIPENELKLWNEPDK